MPESPDLPAELWTRIFDLAADEDIILKYGLPTIMAECAWFKNVFGEWTLRSPQEALNLVQRRSYATKKVRLCVLVTFLCVGSGGASHLFICTCGIARTFAVFMLTNLISLLGYHLYVQTMAQFRRRIPLSMSLLRRPDKTDISLRHSRRLRIQFYGKVCESGMVDEAHPPCALLR